MASKKKQEPSKLFKLKDWLALPDTAQHLTGLMDEKIRESDLLRLALDHHLKLSVNFVNGAIAKCGKVIPYKDAEYYPPEHFAKTYHLAEDDCRTL